MFFRSWLGFQLDYKLKPSYWSEGVGGGHAKTTFERKLNPDELWTSESTCLIITCSQLIIFKFLIQGGKSSFHLWLIIEIRGSAFRLGCIYLLQYCGCLEFFSCQSSEKSSLFQAKDAIYTCGCAGYSTICSSFIFSFRSKFTQWWKWRLLCICMLFWNKVFY